MRVIFFCFVINLDEIQEIEFGKYEKEKHFKLKLTNLLKIARDKFMIKLCIHESESRHTKIGDRNMATVFIATHNGIYSFHSNP